MHIPMDASLEIARILFEKAERNKEVLFESEEGLKDPGGIVTGHFERCDFCKGTGEAWSGMQICSFCDGEGIRRLDPDPSSSS